MLRRPQALSQLDALYDQACQTDEQTAQVFDIHRMMLDDPDFYEGVSGALDQGASAEWAVQQTADGLAAMFEAMEGDEYMQARAVDVRDVAGRLIRILKGVRDTVMEVDHPVIVAAARPAAQPDGPAGQGEGGGVPHQIWFLDLSLRNSGPHLGYSLRGGHGGGF